MARPRSEEARREVLAAAVDVLCEVGVDNLSIEEVAARSKVAKSTIYRHWPERNALVIDAVRSSWSHVATPDTGSLRDDLLQLAEGLVKLDLSAPVGRLMPSLMVAANRDPDLDRLTREVLEERTRPARQVLGRAQDRGELPPDLDLGVAVGLVIGPLVFRRIHQRLPIDRAYLEGCIDGAIAGLGRAPLRS